jgi:hypothetical protein
MAQPTGLTWSSQLRLVACIGMGARTAVLAGQTAATDSGAAAALAAKVVAVVAGCCH